MRHVIDAQGQVLGRLASHIAHILQGKLHADYAPHKSGKDVVVVKNVSKIKLSGKKYDQKIYYHHTQYMGHLKKRPFSRVFENNPSEVLELAVRRMLPKNKLQRERMKRLVIEE